MVSMTSPQAAAEVAVERYWRPRSTARLAFGLLGAVVLPYLGARLYIEGYVDRFPSSVFLAAVVAASVFGRLTAGLIAIAESLVLLDFYILQPRGEFTALTKATLFDFAIFTTVAVLISVVLSGTDRSRAVALQAREAADAAQHKLTLISETSRMLAASFDLPATVLRVCERVAAAGGWDHVVVLQYQRSGPPRYLAGSHTNGSKESPALDEQSISSAISTRQIQILAGNGWRASKLGPWRYRSGLIVPLVTGTETVGALVLLHGAKGKSYPSTELLFAGELGGRIAVAVDNATRYQHQVHIAHTLQQGLLPRTLPGIEGANVYVRYQAGAGTEVGGDFYDVFGVGNNRWMAVIGDVCGKGPEAATVMSITRATLRALALHEPSPKRLLSLLNEALLAQVPDDRFVTVSCAVIDIPPSGGIKLTLSRAGHPAPVIRRKGAEPELAPGPSGMLLGAFPEVDLQETSIVLDPGDVITFYTDGIEARQVAAQDQALALITAHGEQPASEIADRFATAVPNTPAGKADDLVVLTFEFTAARRPVPVNP